MNSKFPQLRKKEYEQVKGVQIDNFKNILPVNFLFVLVGKPGSGKSCLISELLLNKQLYYKKFDRVLFMTPSKIPEIDFIPDTHCSELDFGWIDSQLQKCELKFQEQKIQGNVLICLDDLVSDLKKNENNPALLKLIFNRRHILPHGTISIIITTQKYTACPSKIRSCATGIMLFDINKSDINTIKNELFFMNQKELEIIYKEAFKAPHGFIYILLSPYQIHIQFRPFELFSFENKIIE